MIVIADRKNNDNSKLGLFIQNLGKTALIYSIVTIYLGLCPRIMQLFLVDTRLFSKKK